MEISERLRNRSVLSGALQCTGIVSAALASADPCSDGGADAFAQALRDGLRGHWSRIRSALAGLDEPSAARHAWAASRTDVERACLHLAVVAEGGESARQAVEALRGSVSGLSAWSPLARAVGVGTDFPPEFNRDESFRPGLRLRYLFAARLRRGASLPQLIELSQQIDSASSYVRRRELLRLLKPLKAKAASAQLDPVELTLLSAGARELLLGADSLIEAFIPASNGRDAELRAGVTTLQERRATLEKDGAALAQAIATRDFTCVSRLLAASKPDALRSAVFSRIALVAESELRFDAETGEPEGAKPPKALQDEGGGRWRPLSDTARVQLTAAFPKLRIPAHWSLSAASIAAALCAGSLTLRALTAADLRRLRASWSATAQARLLSAGAHQALGEGSVAWSRLPLRRLAAVAGSRPDLAGILANRLSTRLDTREILGLLRSKPDDRLRRALGTALRRVEPGHSLGEHALPWIGTDRWAKAGGWRLHGDKAKDALAMFVDRSAVAVDSDRFSTAASRALLRMVSPHELAVQLARRDIGVQRALLGAAPLPWLKNYIQAATAHPGLLVALERTVPQGLQVDVYEARLRGATSGAKLLGLMVAGASRGHLPQWNPRWMGFIGKESSVDVAGLTCVVLALHQDLKKLKRVAALVPHEAMSQALRDAARILTQATRNTQPLLELASALGISAAPALASLMGRMRPEDPPGHRLNAAYLKWALPKKAGGTREISAPEPALMLVQRAILASLLTPLGSHPAACGFVKGRSIRDNALPHVGQAIVANADVQSCFPSVRWPLVLAALRRDLGHRFSPPVVQLLVDLCTADGALPTGAPTSPALLNRVLLRTDEILSQAAARRGCQYTRYADDLSFSGNHGAVELLGVAKGALLRIGLQLDPCKTNIFRRGRRQVCTGLVVNERVSVPRRLRRRLRAAVHAVERGQPTAWQGRTQSLASLRGRLAFLRMIHPEEGLALTERLDQAVRGRPSAIEPDAGT